MSAVPSAPLSVSSPPPGPPPSAPPPPPVPAPAGPPVGAAPLSTITSTPPVPSVPALSSSPIPAMTTPSGAVPTSSTSAPLSVSSPPPGQGTSEPIGSVPPAMPPIAPKNFSVQNEPNAEFPPPEMPNVRSGISGSPSEFMSALKRDCSALVGGGKSGYYSTKGWNLPMWIVIAIFAVLIGINFQKIIARMY